MKLLKVVAAIAVLSLVSGCVAVVDPYAEVGIRVRTHHTHHTSHTYHSHGHIRDCSDYHDGVCHYHKHGIYVGPSYFNHGHGHH